MYRESDWLRKKLSEAEIVTVWTGGYQVREPLTTHYLACESADVDAFANYLDDIIAEILILRGSDDTIIRLLDFYQYRITVLKEMGLLEEKKACLKAYNERINQVSNKYQIPTASVYLSFNGPNGDEDPADKGYLVDINHFSHEGDVNIATLLRQLGYAPLAP